MKYIALNYFRRYIKLIKNNKIKFVFGFMFSLILIMISIDLINLVDCDNLEIIYMGIFIYSIAKLFQDIPVINLPYQVLEFKLLKFWKVKVLVLIKCIYPSCIMLNILYLFPMIFKNLSLSKLLLLGMINIMANIICFFISQSKNRSLIRIITVLFLSLIYYLESIYLAIILVLASILKLSMIRYINYDLLLPYSHTLSNISEGLISGNIDGMINSQQLLIKSKSYSKLNLIEKYYDKPNYLLFFKEISRGLYYENNLINISVTIFIISLFLAIMGIDSKVAAVMALMLVISLCDNFLSRINNVESINKNNGFYFPYTTKELIKQKYIPHLFIVSIPLISAILLFKYISVFSFILCFLLLPIKNIIGSFSSRDRLSYRVISFTVLLLCLSNLLG